MTQPRVVTAITILALTVLSLAACASQDNNTPTPTTSAPIASQPTQTSNPQAELTPQQRVKEFIDVSDDVGAKGWKDNSYLDKYLVPELAEKVRPEDEINAKIGAVLTGKRKLSHWTIVEQTSTHATVEFCSDTSDFKAMKDGKPYKSKNTPGKSVGQYKLVRDNGLSPWMIEQMGFYEKGVTCAEHFAS